MKTLWKKLWPVLIATLVAMLLTVLLAEGLIRYRQSTRNGGVNTIEDTYLFDSVLQLRIPKPGLRTKTIQIDSRGFRNPELTMPKPAGTVRIAFLGASTTFCAEVSANEWTWPQVATEQLRQAFPGARIDHINAGVPGYVVDSTRRRLVHSVADLAPDAIVIYHATNDLSGEMRDLARARGLYLRDKAEDDGWLMRNSVLWNLISKNLRIQQARREATSGEGRLTFESGQIGSSFKSSLTHLVLEAKKKAQVVALVTFATQMRKGNDMERNLDAAASALFYMPFMSIDGFLHAYGRYNDIIREVARDHGAILIEAADRIPGDLVHFNDSVHFKDLGSQAMGQVVARELAHAEEFKALVQRGAQAQAQDKAK